MTAPTTDLLALLEEDPAAGILAVADLRELRANAATEGPYVSRTNRADYYGQEQYEIAAGDQGAVWLYIGDDKQDLADAEHIAAEANPAHALAAVRRWRGVVERHRMVESYFPPSCTWCWTEGEQHQVHFPCPDLTETADEARAYLVGAS